MGGFVEEQLKQAVTGTGSGRQPARQQVARRQKVNAMEVAIDDDCSRAFLATRAPAASDLRPRCRDRGVPTWSASATKPER
jgi:phosphate transport system protein